MADISWNDLKSLNQSLQQKRADLQRHWKEQGEREAFWRQEVTRMRVELEQARHELSEWRQGHEPAFESADPQALFMLRQELDEAQAQLATLETLRETLSAQQDELHAAQ